MKFIKNFENYHINEGAIKRLTQDIVDLAVSEKDNWLWKGGSPDDFAASDDRHDFVMNAIDDFNNDYYGNDPTNYGFIEENKAGIVDQIVLALEQDMGLESGVIESRTINEFMNFFKKKFKEGDKVMTPDGTATVIPNDSESIRGKNDGKIWVNLDDETKANSLTGTEFMYDPSEVKHLD